MKISARTSPEEVRALISSAYVAGGHTRGWSYIYGPLASRRNPEVVTIGLNPGGGRADDLDCHLDEHLAQDENDPEIRNSYFDQRWREDDRLGRRVFTPLQLQIQALRNIHFRDVAPERILSFQFIPFRSPSWSDLPRGSQIDAITLGATLLDWTLGQIAQPRLVVGFGLSRVAEHVLQWFGADWIEDVPTGWGSTRAQIYQSPRCRKLVLLPHLSRFRVIGRPEFKDEAKVFD